MTWKLGSFFKTDHWHMTSDNDYWHWQLTNRKFNVRQLVLPIACGSPRFAVSLSSAFGFSLGLNSILTTLDYLDLFANRSVILPALLKGSGSVLSLLYCRRLFCIHVWHFTFPRLSSQCSSVRLQAMNQSRTQNRLGRWKWHCADEKFWKVSIQVSRLTSWPAHVIPSHQMFRCADVCGTASGCLCFTQWVQLQDQRF